MYSLKKNLEVQSLLAWISFYSSLWEVCRVSYPASQELVSGLTKSPKHANTPLQINLEVERGPSKTTTLYIGPSISFHVDLAEGTTNRYSTVQGTSDVMLCASERAMRYSGA